MIAITDISAFTDLEMDNQLIIPNSNEINELIHGTDFINIPIITAVKNLFVSISNYYYNSVFPGFDLKFEDFLISMFKLAGFKKGVNNVISFIANKDSLGVITQLIIDKLILFKSFREKAKNAFSSGSWAKQANDIRAIPNSGLSKIYHIGVYNSINENTLLSTRDENTARFLERIATIKWSSQHPNDKVVVPNDVVYKYITYRWVKSSIQQFNTSEINELFTEDQVPPERVKSFFDAMLLKTYNGLGSKDFGQFHFLHLSFAANSKPILTVKDSAGYYDNGKPRDSFYVKSVSDTNE